MTACSACGATPRPAPSRARDRAAVATAGAAAALMTAAVVWWLAANWEMLLVYPTVFGLGTASLVANDRALARSRAEQGRCPRCGEPASVRTAARAVERP